MPRDSDKRFSLYHKHRWWGDYDSRDEAAADVLAFPELVSHCLRKLHGILRPLELAMSQDEGLRIARKRSTAPTSGFRIEDHQLRTSESFDEFLQQRSQN
jgi:hypothetical protein